MEATRTRTSIFTYREKCTACEHCVGVSPVVPSIEISFDTFEWLTHMSDEETHSGRFDHTWRRKERNSILMCWSRSRGPFLSVQLHLNVRWKPMKSQEKKLYVFLIFLYPFDLSAERDRPNHHVHRALLCRLTCDRHRSMAQFNNM